MRREFDARACSPRAARRPARPGACPASSVGIRPRPAADEAAVEEDADAKRSGAGRNESRAERQRASRRERPPAGRPGAADGARTSGAGERAPPKRAWYGPGERRRMPGAKAAARADAGGGDIGVRPVDLHASAAGGGPKDAGQGRGSAEVGRAGRRERERPLRAAISTPAPARPLPPRSSPSPSL